MLRFFVLALATSGLIGGCFGAGPQLTADALCSGGGRQGNQDFCRDWGDAKRAYYAKRWSDAVRFARRARDARESEGVARLLQDATVAIEAADDGPYNMRLRWCPQTVRLDTRNDLFQLLRCPQARYIAKPSETKDTALENVRARLQTFLNDERHDEITRALFIHVCREEIALTTRDRPARTLTCAWQADQLDTERLRAEVVGLSPAERNQVMATMKRDVPWLGARANKAYPPDSPNRVVFYNLPTRVREAHELFKRNNAEPLRTVQRFRANLAAAEAQTCAPPLQSRLTGLLATARPRTADLRKRLGGEVGVLLGKALAQCHYHNKRLARSAAMLDALAGLDAPTTLADKIYQAQRGATEIDIPKPAFAQDQMSRVWKRAAGSLISGMRRISGVVSGTERVTGGTRLTFKKPRRAEAPPPITVDDATAVEPGRFVELLAPRAGPAAVVKVAANAKTRAKVFRLADVVLTR